MPKSFIASVSFGLRMMALHTKYKAAYFPWGPCIKIIIPTSARLFFVLEIIVADCCLAIASILEKAACLLAEAKDVIIAELVTIV